MTPSLKLCFLRFFVRFYFLLSNFVLCCVCVAEMFTGNLKLECLSSQFEVRVSISKYAVD